MANESLFEQEPCYTRKDTTEQTPQRRQHELKRGKTSEETHGRSSVSGSGHKAWGTQFALRLPICPNRRFCGCQNTSCDGLRRTKPSCKLQKCSVSRPDGVLCSMPQLQLLFHTGLLRSRALLPSTQKRPGHLRARASVVPMDYSEYLDVAKQAATLAGEILLEAWDKPRTVKHKGTVDLVRRASTIKLLLFSQTVHMGASCYMLFYSI